MSLSRYVSEVSISTTFTVKHLLQSNTFMCPHMQDLIAYHETTGATIEDHSIIGGKWRYLEEISGSGLPN